ncbi:MAG: SAM-dependent methyltransferase [Burkholderiaceae bacterium]|nr:SAM-dependent methyltransferase [Burkholderiaceae bacterium]
MSKPPSYGRLLLVPTPIDFGVRSENLPVDLQDSLPLGVIRQAAALSYWVAENAKTARAFLKRVDAVTPLAQPLQAISIIELPRRPKSTMVPSPINPSHLLTPALQGHDVGLVSEAGMPAVADPGATLVQAAHQLGVTVRPLPGVSALLLALAASGLNGQNFAFVGYLPVDAAEKIASIREVETVSRRLGQTQLIIETPYRNATLLAALLAHLRPTTRLSVSCGLTLPNGWTHSDAVAAWRSRVTALPTDTPAVFALLAA